MCILTTSPRWPLAWATFIFCFNSGAYKIAWLLGFSGSFVNYTDPWVGLLCRSKDVRDRQNGGGENSSGMGKGLSMEVLPIQFWRLATSCWLLGKLIDILGYLILERMRYCIPLPVNKTQPRISPWLANADELPHGLTIEIDLLQPAF